MKCNRFKIFLLSACTMFAFGCGDSGDSGNDKAQPGTTNKPGDIVSVQNRTVSGVSQKGPFVTGSTVTVQELNGESLLQTGISFKGKISNDKGEFKVASINLASQYAFLEVNGYYRNEVTGSSSTSPIIMNALADISNRENVNINLLTHLETDRVMHLVTVDGKSFGEAKNQARKELLGYFGIDGNLGAAEDMSIFGQSDDSAALLAISIIVQGNLRESEFTERLARIAGDIADGTIDNPEIWQQMATSAMAQNLRGIRSNVESWGEQVPDFEKYVKAFWRDKLGLGTCNKVGEVKQYENNGIALVCLENGWDKAGILDILNERIGVCDNDGRIEYINYIFDGYSLDLDYDAYSKYPKMGYIICRNGQWESADREETLNQELGVCDNPGTKKTFCNYVDVAEKVESWFDYHELERGLYICGESGWEFAGYDSYYLCDYDEGNCNNGVCDPGEEAYCPQDCDGGEICFQCELGAVNCSDDASIRRSCTNEGGCFVWTDEYCPDDTYCMNGECIPIPSCGDGICDPGENAIVCPVDCNTLDENALGVCSSDNKGEVKECYSSSPYSCNNLYYVCEDNKWQSTDEEAFVNYTLGPCHDDILDEVRGVYLEHKFGMLFYACRGYGSKRRWERVEGDAINGIPCKPDDEPPAWGCFVCVNDKWSNSINDILNDALGVCTFNGDIKLYEGKCNLWPEGQYLVCRDGIWDKLEDYRVPPGSCNEVGTKRRFDGVCYVCGDSKKWETIACE